MTIEQRY